MRLAVFTDNFYPELSGISDVICTLSHALANRGHEIMIVAPRYYGRDYQIIGVSDRLDPVEPHIKVQRLWSIPYPTGTRQGKFVPPRPWLLEKLARFKPDVIHTHQFFGVGVTALSAARILKVPLVGTNHTAIQQFIQYYSPVHTAWATRLVQNYVYWYYRHCQVLTTPSAALRQDMEQAGGWQSLITIPNPVDTSVFTAPVRDHLIPTVIHAGRLAPERSVDVIIRALALVRVSVPQVRLLLAGSGSAKGALRRLVRQLGLEHSVQFLGVLSQRELAEAYHASSLFVITSPAEVQSMTTLQAMATGLPVVAITTPAFTDLVTPDRGILVTPGDHHATAAAIVKVLRNQANWDSYSQHGQTYIQKHCTVDAVAKQWEEIYHQVVK